MIKIILADDHDLVRTGIRRILEDESEFSVIAEAKNGEEAVQLCRKNAPDVVLMDVNMPGIGGLEATKRIVRMSENTRVVCVYGERKPHTHAGNERRGVWLFN